MVGCINTVSPQNLTLQKKRTWGAHLKFTNYIEEVMDETIHQSQKPDKERLGLCWERCFHSRGHSPPWQLSCRGRIQTPLATSDRCCLGGDARHSSQGQRGSQPHKRTPSVVYSHTGGFYSAHFPHFSCLHVVILGCWEMKDVSTFYTIFPA